MNLKDQVTEYYLSPNLRIKMSYQQLCACNMDIGFTSVIKKGRDYHKITRDIALSIMKFENNTLTNLIFSNNHPIRLELADSEIISYYSDYIELRYIISGHSEVEIEGELVHFSENDICFINSMAYHKESICHSNCVLLNISIDRHVFNEAFLNNISLNPLQKFLRTNIMKCGEIQHYLKFSPDSEKANALIQSYIYNIFTEVQHQKPGYIDVSKGYTIRLMDDLASMYHYSHDLKNHSLYTEKLFEAVSEYMKKNLGSISTADLTNEFHFQPNYFNKLIKKYTGVSYSNYLINLRIERAKYLLESSDLNIEEIIWVVGYNNKGFFYKKFQEITGMNPSDYRRLNT